MLLWQEFKNDLNTGKVRVASNENGKWIVNKWVKEVILLGFKFGKIVEFKEGYIDKDTLGEREVKLEETIRTVSPTRISF